MVVMVMCWTDWMEADWLNVSRIQVDLQKGPGFKKIK